MSSSHQSTNQQQNHYPYPTRMMARAFNGGNTSCQATNMAFGKEHTLVPAINSTEQWASVFLFL